MENCIFCRIARHEEPKEFVYEDEDIMVFSDIHPQKPVHLLIVPKKHYIGFMSIDNETLWNKIRQVAQNMAMQNNLTQTGFRLVVNGGGAQIINHFHMHLYGPMGKAI